MDDPIHKGVLPPITLPPQKQFTQSGGYRQRNRLKVLVPDVDNQMNILAAQGFDIDADPRDGTPFYELAYTVTEPTGGGSTNPEFIITDLWELQDNMLERELWALPGVVAEFEKLTGDDKYDKAAFVKRLVEDKVLGKQTTLDNNGTEVSLFPSSIFIEHFTALGLNYAVFDGLIVAYSQGTQAWLVPQPVVRRTRLLPPYTSIQPLQEQAGKVMTREFLISFENPPAGIKFALRAGYYFVRSPNMIQQSDGNWQLRQEWWWSETFNNFIYTFLG